MTRADERRVSVLPKLLGGELTTHEAATSLELSERQV